MLEFLETHRYQQYRHRGKVCRPPSAQAKHPLPQSSAYAPPGYTSVQEAQLKMACKITGILSMGNIMPESNMVGIISISPDTSMAATCVRVTVEISSPSARGDKDE